MKRIGNLKGKPIVEGNPNEIKNNQIHYKEAGGGITLSERKNGNLENITAEGSSDVGGNHYYKFNKENENEYAFFLYGYLPLIPAFILTNGKNISLTFTSKGSYQEISNWYDFSVTENINLSAHEGCMIMNDASSIAVYREGTLEFINIPEGDAKIKFVSLFEGLTQTSLSDEDKEYCYSILDKALTPITKEQYYSLITN